MHVSLVTYLKILGIHFFNLDASMPKNAYTVILSIRLPRIIVAMLVGAALSLSGAVYQGIFRNPMISPDILGASQEAGFGAALAILLDFNRFGIVSVFFTYFISKKVSKHTDATLVLILTGMMLGTLFGSFLSLIKYVADPLNKLPTITFWLMESLTTIANNDIPIILFPFVLGAIPLIFLRLKFPRTPKNFMRYSIT
ncbi:iron ABC transporter permease [Clostridiaceae bacterium 35-E11]